VEVHGLAGSHDGAHHTPLHDGKGERSPIQERSPLPWSSIEHRPISHQHPTGKDAWLADGGRGSPSPIPPKEPAERGENRILPAT
jgi:hypothetical protein